MWSNTLHADVQPLKIGVLTTLTGNWAAIGQNVTRGVTLAINEVNANGGVLGRKIQFETQDTDEELSGAKIISSYRFLRSKGYDIFIGPTGVPGAESLGPIAAKEDVVIVTSAALTHFERFGENLFNVIGDSELTSRAAARWSYEKGMKSASVIRSEQPWEYTQGEFFADEFRKIGGTILSIQESPADEKEFKVQALRIKRDLADVIFLSNFNQVSFAAKALRNFHIETPKVVGLLDDAHLKAASGALENATFFLFQEPSEEFKKKYIGKFGESPGYASDYSYDAIMAIVAAVTKAGSNSPSKLANALKSIEFPSSAGGVMLIGENRYVDRKIKQYRVINNKIEAVE